MTPALLMLPGFDGTGRLFSPLLTALGDEYLTQVVRYEREIEFEEYVVAAAAQLTSNTLLVAESFSGPVALELMRRHPDRICGAVLCATFARSPFRHLTKLAQFAPSRLFASGALQGPILRHFCLDDACAAFLPEALQIAQSMRPITIKQRLVVLSRIDMRGVCAGLHTPTLLLRATRDRVVGRRVHDELAACLPRARTESIDGPHMLLQARPRDCALAIGRFVRSCIG